MIDWKKVARDRLRRICVLEARSGDTGEIVRRAMQHAIHASCFASLGDERTQRLIDMVVTTVECDLRGKP